MREEQANSKSMGSCVGRKNYGELGREKKYMFIYIHILSYYLLAF
jgi:hypothetical protein